MNYIKEINAFYDRLELNSLSSSAIALWFALMHINNKAAWTAEFTVAVSVLSVKTGLSERTISNARNELKQKGYIDFRSRKGNQSAVYKIFSLLAIDAEKESKKFYLQEINADSLSDNVSDNRSDSLSDNVSALNKHKRNETNNIPYVEIVDYLNFRTNKKYKHSTKSTNDKIKARWKDGFRLEHFKRVIDNKVNQWLDDPKMQEYLRPETLFGTKFESYLNQSMNQPNQKDQEITRKQQEKKSFDMEVERNRWVEKHGTIDGFAEYWSQLTSKP